MILFLKLQYRLGRISDDQLRSLVNAGRLSESDYQEIIGGE